MDIVGSVRALSHVVAALLLAHLTVPSQLLESFGFYPVGNGLGRQEVVFGHLVVIVERLVVLTFVGVAATPNLHGK